MADKRIIDLEQADELNDNGLLVLYQSGKTQKMQGSALKRYISEAANLVDDEIIALGNAQVEKINEIGTSVFESIPEDYTELSNKVEKLGEDFEKTTAETAETISGIQTDKADKSSTYTKSEIDTKLNEAGKVKSVNGKIGEVVISASDIGYTPSPELIESAVSDWLDEHPEATTTVPDGSITRKKLADGVMPYVTPEMFGAVGDGVTDDTAAIQTAINTGLPILFGKAKTYIAVELVPYYGMILFGNGATLKRPDLKAEPYNYTDSQIMWLRMINFTHRNMVEKENVHDLLTEIHDLTIDVNGYTIWRDTSKFDYEQAIAVFLSGTEEHKMRILFENVHFKNNYTSNITVSNHVDMIMHHCTCYNCAKGLCTVVGYNDSVVVDDCHADKDAQYSYQSFWYEVNNPGTAETQNSISITRSSLIGNILVTPTEYGLVSISDCTIHANGGTLIATEHTDVNMVNCSVKMETALKVRGNGTARFTNCDFTSKNGENDCVTLSAAINRVQTITAFFTNCVFHNALRGITFATGSVLADVFIDGCVFKDISVHAIGPQMRDNQPDPTVSNGSISYNKCVISNSTFDVDGYISYQSGSSTSPTPTFNGGNDVINPDNKGIYTYGGETFVFKNELWSVPVSYAKYRSGTSFNPIGFGKRTTLMAEPPTSAFVGINDIDYVKLTVAPYTVYKYTNNQWAVDTGNSEGGVTDEHINSLIDSKLSEVEPLADDILEVL